MTKIALLGGSYKSRSIIGSSQRCLNLYPEMLDPHQSEPFPMMYLPTPGLTRLATSPTNEAIRCTYRASNGDLYVVSGKNVYYVDNTFAFNFVGSFIKNNENPVIMTDNGTNIIMCDGSDISHGAEGYSVVMSTHAGFLALPSTGTTIDSSGTTITNGWLGSTWVDFSDTFLIANEIGTPSFYISESESTLFDALDFAGKSAKPDFLVAAIASHRVIWLIGKTSTEVWYNTGGGGLGNIVNNATPVNTFPFEIMPGISIEDGCVAPYSIAKADTMIYWLAQNLNGEAYVLLGAGDKTQRISNHAIEHIWNTYPRIDDAIAYCYLQEGHQFYVINFPTADATWVYELGTKEWHERAWLDADGFEHRHRGAFHAFAYGKNIVGDWENGNIYFYDLDTYLDNGLPIKRLRSFPQQLDNDNNNRVFYKSFIANMQTGSDLDPSDPALVSLRWSNDGGNSWGNALEQSMGRTGQYLTNIQWNRLGYARNRVFELSWAINANTALTGAFLEAEAGQS